MSVKKSVRDLISVIIPQREQDRFLMELAQLSEEITYVLRDSQYTSKLPMHRIKVPTKFGLKEVIFPKPWVFTAPIPRRLNISSVIHAVLRTEFERPGGDVRVYRSYLEDLVTSIIDIQEHGYYKASTSRLARLKTIVRDTMRVLEDIGVIKVTDDYVYYFDDNPERWTLDLVSKYDYGATLIRNIKELLVGSMISTRAWTTYDLVDVLTKELHYRFGVKIKDLSEIINLYSTIDLVVLDGDKLVYQRKKPLYIFAKELELTGVERNLMKSLIDFYNYIPVFSYTKTLQYIYTLTTDDRTRLRMIELLNKTIDQAVRDGFVKMGDILVPERVMQLGKLFDTNISNPIVFDIIEEIIYRVPVVDGADLRGIYSKYRKTLMKVLDELVRSKEVVNYSKLISLCEDEVEKHILSTLIDILVKRKIVEFDGVKVKVSNVGIIKAVMKILGLRPLIYF